MLEKLRSGIIFDKSPIKVLLFSNRSISILQKFIQNSPSKNEAGGIIIGEVKGQHMSHILEKMIFKKGFILGVGIIIMYYFMKKSITKIHV